ncbi:MocR-like pyridoxine biosynthesis transcription factor PdxR [Spiribacter halobius]|nr:PLP-dependent aminotransferase family protein [Spiribacter halobius]UEX79236.1 PLP-dependent aminotransferase family protein [Spiribacter halobius]
MGRKARAASAMWYRLYETLDADAGSPRARVQNLLVQAVVERFLAPGDALPSGRTLARRLGVARSTVTAALRRLMDLGYVESRERSGYYVHPRVQRHFADGGAVPKEGTPSQDAFWEQRFRMDLSGQRNIAKPPDWQDYRYPFLYGQFDARLFPRHEWRDCVRASLSLAGIKAWAPDLIDRDEPSLIRQLQTQLLPARGVWVGTDEILVTAGAQNALFLLAMLLVEDGRVVGVEDPGYPDARNIFEMHGGSVRPIPMDDHGIVVGEAIRECDYLFVTPSHQCPTGVTLPIDRRERLIELANAHGVVIIEDDHESELNFASHPTPALKSLDQTHNVVYIGSLSKTLAHGMRLGYVAGPAALIRELRKVRRLCLRHPANNNEFTAAQFIRNGYHEAYVNYLNGIYRERSQALEAAIRRHLPAWRFRQREGGSALWVQGPANMHGDEVAAAARQQGVLVEPGHVFFSDDRAPRNYLRMGYSSISAEDIDEGIRRLAEVPGVH